jgi:hypothetical protein
VNLDQLSLPSNRIERNQLSHGPLRTANVKTDHKQLELTFTLMQSIDTWSWTVQLRYKRNVASRAPGKAEEKSEFDVSLTDICGIFKKLKKYKLRPRRDHECQGGEKRITGIALLFL